MPFPCLCDFLEELERSGDLVRIEAEIDPRFEAAQIARQACATSPKAVLMGCMAGHDMPVVVNLLATEQRICKALGVENLAEAAQRLQAVIDPADPQRWFERMKTAPDRALLGKTPPKEVKAAAVQQVVRLGADVDLKRIPFLHVWPDEPGRAITAGLFCSKEVDGDRRLVAPHQVEIIGRDRMAVRWNSHDEAGRLFQDYRRYGRSMPAAVVLGGDPVGFLAAASPLIEKADVWAFAGLLRQRPLDLVACRSVDLKVPADAEIVIEGTLNPDEDTVESGPWCSPCGYLEPPRPAHVMRVTAITQRANPVCPAMVLGPMSDQSHGTKETPNEWVTISRAMAEVVSPLIRLAIPELIGLELPAAGSGRHMAFVSIRKAYAGQARRVAGAIWGLPSFMFCKLLVIVDEDIDVRDQTAVWNAVSTMAAADRDVFFNQGPPNPADPAVYRNFSTDALQAATGRMAIDATRKLEAEGARQAKPAKMDEEIIKAVQRRWQEFGLG